MYRSLRVAAPLILTLAAVGCGGADAADQPPPADVADADVVVVAEDVAFVDPPREIATGTVTLALDNRGHAPHDVTFEGPEGTGGTVAAADGRSQTTGQVTLDPGTYVVYCSVPGHRQAGMEFEVTAG